MTEIILSGKLYKYSVLASEIDNAVAWATYLDAGGDRYSAVRYFPISDTELRIDWSDDLVGADPADIQAVWDAHDAEVLSDGELDEQDILTRKEKALAILQPLVGQRFDQMLVADRWAIITATLFALGVLDGQIQVRPLKDWDIL